MEDESSYVEVITPMIAILPIEIQMDFACECVGRIVGIWNKFDSNETSVVKAVQLVRDATPVNQLRIELGKIQDAEHRAMDFYNETEGMKSVGSASLQGVVASKANLAASAAGHLLMAKIEDEVVSDCVAWAVALSLASTHFDEKEKAWQSSRLESLLESEKEN